MLSSLNGFSLKVSVMASITLTLTGNSSLLRTTFHPEIELDQRYTYSCSLLDFYTYNSIPNVHESNNKFHYRTNEKSENQVIIIPIGAYEVEQIGEFIGDALREKDHRFRLFPNLNTMKCRIESDVFIDFSQPNSIGSILGFGKQILKGETYHIADDIVNIQTVNSIRVDCDLTTGSFHNGKSTHTIYEFTPSVDHGYKISEQPKHLIYLPLIRHRISELNISIVDQDGRLVDFRGEKITCRVHIKRDT